MELSGRIVAVALLPLITFICIAAQLRAGPLLVAWMVLALTLDRLAARITPTDRLSDRTATVLCIAAPLLQGALLLYALSVLPEAPIGPARIAVIVIMLGISAGTIGTSAAHELIHRRGAVERAIGRAFMFLVTYPHFPLVHLRVHHPYVGTAVDPGTSRLNEPLMRFIARAYALSWRSGWRVEQRRLAHRGVTPWSWRNGIVRALALQTMLYAGIGVVFGWQGLALFFAQSVVAMSLTLTIDYTQHYGVVRREIAPERLERLRAWHSWSSDHPSNRSMFNMGMHADHHLTPALAYQQLVHARGALQTPFGYPGLLLLAMVPPLWYRVMNPLLEAGEHNAA